MSSVDGSGGPPSRLRLTLVTWLAVYPLLTLILFLAGPLLNAWPLPLRTLAVTMLLVPTLTYVVLPMLHQRLHRWLQA